MRLPNSLFDKKEFIIGEEDEDQENYLQFREDLAKGLFLNLASIKGPFHLRLLGIVNDMLQKVPTLSELSLWPDAELPLFIINHMHQILTQHKDQEMAKNLVQ
jgi:hypothetical protein